MKATLRRIVLAALGILVALCFTTVASASATTLYVAKGDPNCTDSGSGTTTRPFCTIKPAAARATAGTTVQVASGTYNEIVTVANSGTATAPVSFVTAPGAAVTVGSGHSDGFYISAKNYVSVEGFTITGTTSDAIVVKASTHITIRRNHVSFAGQPAVNLTAKGIRIEGSNDSVFDGNTVDHNTNYGIYLLSGSTRNQVTANRVFANARQIDRSASGIRVHGSTNNTISGNVTFENEDSGIELVTGANGNLVVDNISYNNGDHGIDITGNVLGATAIANTVYNNVTAGINLEGGSTGGTVMNNVSVDNGINSPRTTGNIRADSTSTMGATIDYNVVFIHGVGRNYEWGLLGYDTLAEMQAVSGQETHSIQADPKWTSPSTGDFTLGKGSPAIDDANSGVAGAPTADAVGNARVDDPRTVDTGVGPRTYDDRGALEYLPQHSPPSAALTVSPNAGAINLDVTADASASTDDDGLSPIAGYQFDFGDGSPLIGPQAGPTAPHRYTAPGTYTVRVTVTDTAGNASQASSVVTVRDDPPAAALTMRPSSGHAPLDVVADASASTDVDATGIASYSFDWGDGTPATGAQTAATAGHTYADIGTYTVTATVTDTAGNSSQRTAQVTAFGPNVPPDAQVDVTPRSGDVDLTVTADASASTDGDAGIASYSFDWGDGSGATDPQSDPVAKHTYRAAGTYTVTVTVTDQEAASSTATATVTVTDPPPAAKLAVSPSSGLAPVAVSADASASTDDDGTPISSYAFDWGDGSAVSGPSTAATASHTYTRAGTYTVKVTATDTAGQQSTAIAAVIVRANLAGNPDFESSLTGWNTAGSAGGVTLDRVAGGHGGDWSAQLTNTTTTAATCALNDSPDWVRPSVAGRYAYSIWVRGATAGATIKARVTEYSGTTNVGNAVTAATLTTSWQKLTLGYTTVAPGSTLDYNVYVVGAAPGTCFLADDVLIDAPHQQPPSAALSVTPRAGAIDLDVTADASASEDDDGLSPIASYSFDFGDGSPATGPQAQPTATHRYRAPGSYTVRVVVTDTAGSTAEATSVVQVRDDAPAAALDVSPGSGEAPMTVSADGSKSTDTDATGIASYSFDWGDDSPGTGPQSAATATHTYSAPGTYVVTVTVTDTAGQASTATQRVDAFATKPPVAALSIDPTAGVAPVALTADASASTDPDSAIDGYAFDWGDGSPVSGPGTTPTATHTYTQAGTYTVTVTATDPSGQSSTASKQVVVRPNLVGNPSFESSLTGWNTSGSSAGATLARVAGGHDGGWSAQATNGAATAGTCALNDSPDWVRSSVAGDYAYSIWVRADTPGATIKSRVTEYSGSTNAGTAVTTATLSTDWQKLTLAYTPVAPGSTLDWNVYVVGAAPGACFYADDAVIDRQ